MEGSRDVEQLWKGKPGIYFGTYVVEILISYLSGDLMLSIDISNESWNNQLGLVLGILESSVY